MNRMIILDDRKERKNQFLSEETIIKLNKYEQNGLLQIQADIPSDFEDLKKLINKYSLIAIHYTWLNVNGLYDNMIRYFENSDKYLIIFSGAIDQTNLLNGDKILKVNVSKFYTNALVRYINDYVNSDMYKPLLQFLYGKHWRLPLLLKYRYSLWINDDDKLLDELRRIFNRNQSSIIIDEIKWVNQEIRKENNN